ncbi:MAG: hypothetical protein DI582_10445 [Azospirillum brasilense]|nr:MAG: hypothetical protein DI582_10445 [Azospirillum brasilense]
MLHIPVSIDALITGQLSFDSDALRHLSSLRPSMIRITANHVSERRDVEAFIERIYAKTYGAVIGQHYPTLISVRDAEGRILAALGFRAAGEQKLFLEQYLDVPAEQAVGNAFGVPLSRGSIVEVGNLASAGHGAAVFLFAALMAYLDCMGISHIALTGTKILRGYFAKLGLDPRDMGRADPSRLADHGASWGTYYDTDPRLIGGDVHASFQQLQKVMLVEQVCEAGMYEAQLHSKAALC